MVSLRISKSLLFSLSSVCTLLTTTHLLPAAAQGKVYEPIPIAPGKQISDKLTSKDIPTGQSGFARDYVLELAEGTQLAIDLSSDNFDTIITLLASDGSTVAENDDGPDGTTNSLLFVRITKTGTYYIRVRAFGELSAGNYKLKVTLLQSVEGK
ncbi:MAG TPA: PPC domain-containing protein [Leptolyngbyaceae cyanobacterium M33_DOE_097]|uniref:Peptidase n=1 Tax=Oscillatoriales cyanobacterium SpSt-418 TaxID=2282169 RepID=A0A7C3KB28_9CYAN|nr:PPC domain-containing protein [Leptolyngbyaceae cyanobacterium M33_DOE_097]